MRTRQERGSNTGCIIMSAHIIAFPDIAARKSKSRPLNSNHTLSGQASWAQQGVNFHCWRGASGRQYLHAVHPLEECPRFASGNVIFVRRDVRGHRKILSIGRFPGAGLVDELNPLRRLGLALNADEVHVCLFAKNETERKLIECDLRAGQFTSRFSS